jgi:flavin-dependent dehydrogenase
VPLLQAIVRLPPDLSPDTTRVWFDPADTPYFYWLIPESPTRGVLGLIGEDGRETRRCLERFLARQRLEPIEFQAARIPAYAGWVPNHRRVGQGDVYLVGDAAAQVKATTVGGIVTGFRGALSVAGAILNGGARREQRALKRELDRHLLIREVLHRFTHVDYARLLDVVDRSAQRVLGLHNRDEIGTLLWRLCVRRPRFLLLGLRALLTSRFDRERADRW